MTKLTEIIDSIVNDTITEENKKSYKKQLEQCLTANKKAQPKESIREGDSSAGSKPQEPEQIKGRASVLSQIAGLKKTGSQIKTGEDAPRKSFLEQISMGKDNLQKSKSSKEELTMRKTPVEEEKYDKDTVGSIFEIDISQEHNKTLFENFANYIESLQKISQPRAQKWNSKNNNNSDNIKKSNKLKESLIESYSQYERQEQELQRKQEEEKNNAAAVINALKISFQEGIKTIRNTHEVEVTLKKESEVFEIKIEGMGEYKIEGDKLSKKGEEVNFVEINFNQVQEIAANIQNNLTERPTISQEVQDQSKIIKDFLDLVQSKSYKSIDDKNIEVSFEEGEHNKVKTYSIKNEGKEIKFSLNRDNNLVFQVNENDVDDENAKEIVTFLATIKPGKDLLKRNLVADPITKEEKFEDFLQGDEKEKLIYLKNLKYFYVDTYNEIITNAGNDYDATKINLETKKKAKDLGFDVEVPHDMNLLLAVKNLVDECQKNDYENISSSNHNFDTLKGSLNEKLEIFNEENAAFTKIQDVAISLKADEQGKVINSKNRKVDIEDNKITLTNKKVGSFSIEFDENKIKKVNDSSIEFSNGQFDYKESNSLSLCYLHIKQHFDKGRLENRANQLNSKFEAISSSFPPEGVFVKNENDNDGYWYDIEKSNDEYKITKQLGNQHVRYSNAAETKKISIDSDHIIREDDKIVGYKKLGEINKTLDDVYNQLSNTNQIKANKKTFSTFSKNTVSTSSTQKVSDPEFQQKVERSHALKASIYDKLYTSFSQKNGAQKELYYEEGEVKVNVTINHNKEGNKSIFTITEGQGQESTKISYERGKILQIAVGNKDFKDISDFSMHKWQETIDKLQPNSKESAKPSERKTNNSDSKPSSKDRSETSESQHKESLNLRKLDEDKEESKSSERINVKNIKSNVKYQNCIFEGSDFKGKTGIKFSDCTFKKDCSFDNEMIKRDNFKDCIFEKEFINSLPRTQKSSFQRLGLEEKDGGYIINPPSLSPSNTNPRQLQQNTNQI